jgi:hypothetical protein
VGIQLSNVASAAERDWSDDAVGKLKEAGNMKFKIGEYRQAIEVCLSVLFSA